MQLGPNTISNLDGNTLAALFIERCQSEPDRLAYAFVRDTLDLAESVTYGQLLQQVCSLAGQLIHKSSAGDRVLLVYPPGIDFVRAFWACCLTGRIAVPVPAPDAARFKNSAARLLAIMRDATASLILTTPELSEPAESLQDGAKLHRLEIIATRSSGTEGTDLLLEDIADEVRAVHPDTVAYLQYTSGSTSSPRGVVLTHRNVLAQCLNGVEAVGLSENSRIVAWLPHHHDYGLVLGVLWPLYVRAPAYLMSPLTFLRRPLRWLEAIARFRITHSGGPNFAYAACVRAASQQPGWSADLSSLQATSCGAEPIQFETLQAFIRVFSPFGLTEEAVRPSYGMAETVLGISTSVAGSPLHSENLDAASLARHRVKRLTSDSDNGRRIVCCGRPFRDMEVAIVNPQTLQRCEAAEVGEIWVRGCSVGQGYWNQPEATEATFHARLASGEGPWLHTGDLGFMQSGEVFVTGRLKDLLIVRGRNLYPQDLEWTAQATTPALRAGFGAAFSIDTENGEEAVIVQELERREQGLDLQLIAAGIRQAIAEEFELPLHSVVLVRTGTLPRTSSGKIRRSSCRQDFLTGKLQVLHEDVKPPADLHSQIEAKAETSGTSVPLNAEDLIRQTIARLAGVDASELSSDSSPIAAGLDSLEAARLSAALEDKFHVSLPAVDILRSPTIGVLVKKVAHQAQHGSVEILPGAKRVRLDRRPAPAVPVRTAGALYPLSAAQQRMWFWQELAPGTAMYNVPVALQMEGPVIARLLQDCLLALIQRHEVLRSRWVLSQGAQLQRIEPAYDWRLKHEVLQDSGVRSVLQQYDALAAREALHPFDLTVEPAVRAVLVSLSANDHRLLLNLHHSVCDGWSVRILLNELCHLYEVGLRGMPADLPRLELQHLDFAQWESAWLASGVREHELAYWTAQLVGAPPALPLFTDRRRPSQQRFRGAAVSLRFSAVQLEGLRSLSRRSDTTLFMVLLAAWQSLLHIYSGQSTVVTGSVIANREHHEFDRVVGYFANTVALRSDFDDALTVDTLLAQVKAASLGAYEHQHVPFEDVIEALHLPRDLSRMPLVQTFFVLQPPAPSEYRLGDVRAHLIPLAIPVARFDLALELQEWNGELDGSLTYDSDLFERATIERMVGHLHALVNAMCADSHLRISGIPLLGSDERKLILGTWNDTHSPFPIDVAVHQLIERQATDTPAAVAVSFDGQSLAYEALNAQANRLAHHLRGLGIGPDVMVGICMERSIEMVVGYLAVLKAGGAIVPLDPEQPHDRLAHMLQDTAAPVVLTQSHLLHRIPSSTNGAQAHRLCLDKLLVALPAGDEHNPEGLTKPDHLAYVIYTSGSTGQPKGVMVPHRALSNVLRWSQQAVGIAAGDRMLQKTTISFDPSLLDMLLPLLAGATTVMARPGEQFETDSLVQTMRSERITHVIMVPSQLRVLLEEPAIESCSDLRYVIAGGEALDVDLARKVQQRLPHVTLGNFYGPTETAIVSVQCEVPRNLGTQATMPIGRPIANTQCYVLDARHQPVPVGVTGELYIGGAGLARGYLNRPDLTAERFLPHRFEPGQRVYATGDLVRWLPDGQLEYVGRSDFQVKIRGIRIELGEIEAALNALPAVQQAVVMAREDHPGHKQLVAYVVAPATETTELRQALEQQLPQALVPTAFVKLDRIPMLPSGKADRRQLPAPARETLAAPSSKPPSTATEQALAGIWQEVLRVTSVGREDSFFELGGHSLLATQVVSRVRMHMQVKLPLRAIFHHPTLAGLAAEIDLVRAAAGDASTTGRALIVPVSRTGPLPVSFSQRRMWLVQQMNPETTAYNMPFGIRLIGTVDTDKLEQALNLVAKRHEAFRTRFELVDGEPMQVIESHTPLHIDMVDLSGWAEDEREQQAQLMLTERSQRPFDLARSGLHHATLLHLSPNDHILLWVIHHAVGDLWSGGVLLRDLSAIYESLLIGVDLVQAPRAIEYADYAVWQRGASHQGDLERQMTYWRERLQGLSAITLSTDLQRRSAPSGRGGNITAALAPETIEKLKRFSAALGATPFMILLTCFKMLLARYCGQDDIAVGTPIANRHHLESEHLVGTFVNTLVMRTDLSGNPDFTELLGRVRERSLEAFANQDASFEQLVEMLSVGRELSSSPLVQVMFNVVNAPFDLPSLGGLDVKPFTFDRGAAQFDLSMTVDTEIFGQIHIEYATDLFVRSTAQRILDSYVNLLNQVLSNQTQRIQDFDMQTPLSLAELAAWNTTAMQLPHEQRVDQLISSTSLRYPQDTSLWSGNETLSYAALDARTNRLARTLRARGIGRGTLVGLCVDRGIDMVVAQLAILKSGAAYVPLDPAYPADRLAYMAEDARLALLVTESALVHALHWPRAQSLLLDIDAAAVAAQPDTPLPADGALDARPEDPAYVIYTSGSTGKPKGVVVHHRAVVNFLASMAREPGLTAQDTLVAVTTLSFDIAVLELLLPLSVGARVVLASRDQALDGVALRDLIESAGATVMQATPSTWRILIDSGWQGSASFKALIGGEGLPQDLASQLLARTGELWNMYGPTETTVWSTCWKVVNPENGISIGRPIANTTVHILDERLQRCPIGVPGEIFIGGDGVTLGYLHRPELTAERFIPDPFSPGARLYRTGDRGRWRHDGLLEHMGRLDFQAKVRGYRIELGEIESNLASHPQVARTTVIVREDTPGDVRLVAYVVPRDGMLEVQALRDHLRTTLPDYMVPQHFIELDAIPLLPNGKINRHELPAPTESSHQASSNFVAPVSAAEQVVAEVWQRLLGVAQVGVTDNFFNLGGHSLLAMRVVTELNQRFGAKVTIRQLIFDNLGQIAACITVPAGVSNPPGADADKTMDKPDAPAVKGWLGKLADRFR